MTPGSEDQEREAMEAARVKAWPGESTEPIDTDFEAGWKAHREWAARVSESWRMQVQEAHVDLDQAGVPLSPQDRPEDAYTVPTRTRMLIARADDLEAKLKEREEALAQISAIADDERPMVLP